MKQINKFSTSTIENLIFPDYPQRWNYQDLVAKEQFEQNENPLLRQADFENGESFPS